MKDPQRNVTSKTISTRGQQVFSSKLDVGTTSQPLSLSSCSKGVRVASLEASYKRVAQIQAKDARAKDGSSALYNSVGVISSLPSREQYVTSMYHLSQSEPVYLDLEHDITSGALATSHTSMHQSALSKQSDLHRSCAETESSKSSEQSKTLEKNLDVAAVSRSCWPGPPLTESGFRRKAGPYHNFRSPTKSKQTDDVVPILFGDILDTGSVATGMSQQELLRKKARADNRMRNKDKTSRSKGKKKDRILQMPTHLMSGSGKYHMTNSPPSAKLKKGATVSVKYFSWALCFTVRTKLTAIKLVQTF
jgi:hypothetical protein